MRICKGAYKEPASVAYPDKKDVDANYVKCMHALIEHGQLSRHRHARPGDHRRGEAVRDGAGRSTASRFEFQMLYGVRRDLQEQLVREGYRMRVYVPFGTQWYPYLMRRLAERPANVAFITGNVMRRCSDAGNSADVHARRHIARRSLARATQSTIGGYAAVHGRPAAFEGSDGFSYSVEIDDRRRRAMPTRRGARSSSS